MRELSASGRLTVTLCVIGAGLSGVTVAVAAARLGASVVLIERDRVGGAGLHAGPIAQACLRRAALIRSNAGLVGVRPADMGGVRAEIRAAVAQRAAEFAPSRLAALGVQVLAGSARFIGPERLAVDGVTVEARRFVIATGSEPIVPAIPGLADTKPFTGRTLFDNDSPVSHLLVLGSGALAVASAQAYRRLGAAVTILANTSLLPTLDAEMVAVLQDRLAEEGVSIRHGVSVERIERSRSDADPLPLAAIFSEGEVQSIVRASHILVAEEERPALAGLDLHRAGVAHDANGVRRDRRLRTSNRRISAVGGAAHAPGPYTQHFAAGRAELEARVVIANTLLRWPARIRPLPLPRLVLSDPELAEVGLTEAEALRRGGKIRIARFPFRLNDRATAEGAPDGFVKAIIGPDRRILGAAIVGAGAGDLLLPWSLAIGQGLPIEALAQTIAAAPTYGAASVGAAASVGNGRFDQAKRTLAGWLRTLPG